MRMIVENPGDVVTFVDRVCPFLMRNECENCFVRGLFFGDWVFDAPAIAKSAKEKRENR